MSIFVIGINHKTAPIALREQVFFALDKLPLYLQDLLYRGFAEEAVLLSTCNRSELYCHAEDIRVVRDWFCQQTMAPREQIEAALYVHQGEAAIEHMMNVACGLDSMVLGEPQILGQVKEAFSESCTIGAVSSVFYRLFQQIFSVAKEIRSVTAIGACPVSVASAAIHFAKSQLSHFATSDVVLIGAGDTTELMLRYLSSQVRTPVTIVNRSVDKATDLVDEWGGKVYGLDQLATALITADVVFSATGSALPIVTKKIMSEVMTARQRKPLLMLDLAVPRDIDPAVAEVSGAQLYCIDDLKMIIETNRQGREHAGNKAREMIYRKSREFYQELQSFDKVAHTIRAYRGQIQALCQTELGRAKQKLQQGGQAEQVLEAFATAFTNKLLHAPSVQLRQAGQEGRFELLRFAKELFAIKDAEIEIL